MVLSSKVLTLFLSSLLPLSVIEASPYGGGYGFGDDDTCNIFGQCGFFGPECAYDGSCTDAGTLGGNCCEGFACANGLECDTIVYYGEEFDRVCCKPDYGYCYNNEDCCANDDGLNGGPTRQCINSECLCPSYVDTSIMTWEAHRANAISQGCQLASINSVQEQQYFESLYTNAGLATQIWLGGTYVDTQDGNGVGTTTGNIRRGWTWIDGSNWDERLAQDLWRETGSNQPNTGSVDQKLAWFSNFDWDDGGPTVPLPAFYKCCGQIVQ